MADQFMVYHDPTVIDPLVHAVKGLFPVRDRELCQLIPDLLLHIHVTDAVCLKQLPLLRCIGRKVSCPSTVCLGRLARHTEKTDQFLSLRQLFLIEVQRFSHALQ